MAGTILNEEKDSGAKKARKIEQQEKQKKCYKPEVNFPSPHTPSIFSAKCLSLYL